MKTITVSLTENDFKKYNFAAEIIDFSELFNKISIEIARQAAYKCHEIAQKTGLSAMTQADIDEEVRSVRTNAQNRS